MCVFKLPTHVNIPRLPLLFETRKAFINQLFKIVHDFWSLYDVGLCCQKMNPSVKCVFCCIESYLEAELMI